MRRIRQIDLVAKPEQIVQVEVLPEVGTKDKFKLYINIDGVCVLRVCKLLDEQIQLNVDSIL